MAWIGEEEFVDGVRGNGTITVDGIGGREVGSSGKSGQGKTNSPR